MRPCSAFERLSLEGGGHGDESFCPVKDEENHFSLLNVVIFKELSSMHLRCVQE